MKFKHFIFIIFAVFISSCADNKIENQTKVHVVLPSTEIMWIGPEKVACQGVMQQTCYMTNKLVAEQVSQWQLFYDDIEGFDFSPGTFYQLAFKRVKESESIVDISDSRYVMTKQIIRTPQKYLLNSMLTKHRHWYLKSANNVTDFKVNSADIPPMLRLSGDSFSGFTGCNKMFGSIEYLFEAQALRNALIKLGSVGTTRRACKDPMLNAIEKELQHSLPLVNRFVVRWPHLKLYKNSQLVFEFVAEDWD